MMLNNLVMIASALIAVAAGLWGLALWLDWQDDADEAAHYRYDEKVIPTVPAGLRTPAAKGIRRERIGR